MSEENEQCLRETQNTSMDTKICIIGQQKWKIVQNTTGRKKKKEIQAERHIYFLVTKKENIEIY